MSLEDTLETTPPPRTLSNVIEDAIESCDKETVSFDDMLNIFGERGFGMILMVVAAPMSLPLPVPPGFNLFLAVPLLLLTLQLTYGAKHPWLPQRFREKTIKRTSFVKLMNAFLPWIRRIEKLTRARLGLITEGLFIHVIGIMATIMALSVLVPIPLTNTVPSFGIVLMSIGILMRDGLAVIAGALIGLSWVAMLLIVGDAGIDYVRAML